MYKDATVAGSRDYAVEAAPRNSMDTDIRNLLGVAGELVYQISRLSNDVCGPAPELASNVKSPEPMCWADDVSQKAQEMAGDLQRSLSRLARVRDMLGVPG
jgi:hypothetical protein